MNTLRSTITLLFLLGTVAPAFAAAEITGEQEKISYSVGYQVGGDFKRQGLDIEPKMLLKGIQDALSGAEPAMTPQEMQSTLVALKQRITADQNKARSEAGAANLIEGKAFLAGNAKKEGVTTTSSGLQYVVEKPGSGESPKATDTVTVHYRGTLLDGTEFDSSYSRGQPATFALNRVIKGWTEGVQLMKPGAKYRFFIPADLAYGERGAGAKIGPNSALIFEVELLEVK